MVLAIFVQAQGQCGEVATIPAQPTEQDSIYLIVGSLGNSFTYIKSYEWQIYPDSIAMLFCYPVGGTGNVVVFYDTIPFGYLTAGVYKVHTVSRLYTIPGDTMCHQSSDFHVMDTSITVSVFAGLNKKDEHFSLFPNPTSNTLQLHCTTELLNEKVTVIDALGREVYNTVLTATHVALNTLQWASGVYVVRIGGVVRRVIKE